mgnify:FL=1
MSDLEHGRELLEMARADLNALKGMLNSDHPYFSDEIFGFHAQQAAEKSMKARLAVLGVEYPKRHDLMVFINLLQNAGEDVVGLSDLVDLNPFGVQYRYESLPDDDDHLDRVELLGKIEHLFSRIEKLLD